MSFGVRDMPLNTSPEDAEMSEGPSEHLPIPNTISLLVRDAGKPFLSAWQSIPLMTGSAVQGDPSANLSNASADSCQIAAGLLREDFAGHGLPLTSLVIESSTLLLLAGLVLYFLRRSRLQRRPMVYLSASNVSSPLPTIAVITQGQATDAPRRRPPFLSPSRTGNLSSSTRRQPRPNTASRRSPRSTRTPCRPRLRRPHRGSTRTWPRCLRCAGRRAAPRAQCRARPLFARAREQALLRVKAAASRRSRASFR